MNRARFNRTLLEKCISNLRSSDIADRCEGAVWASYLIEQAIKTELRRMNPLLYYDRRGMNSETEVKIAQDSHSHEEERKLKTISARQGLVALSACKPDVEQGRAVFYELLEWRNFLLHSVNSLGDQDDSFAESAVSALKAFRGPISRLLGIRAHEIDPLTSREFLALQARQEEKRLESLKNKIHESRESFQTGKHVIDRNTNSNRTDQSSWVEETYECPSCEQGTLNKICSVDFDWNPDGIITSAGCSFHCSTCDLELSEHEYNLASSLKTR